MNSIKVVLQKELARVFHDKKLVFSLFIMPDEVELILIMSVEPGFGGQKYIPESTERSR